VRWLLVALAACSSPSTPSSPSVVEPAPIPDVPIALPRIVAHRGASHEAPENTLAAFRRAWEIGVECVELDVHLTKDGEVVVMHDSNTNRITGRDHWIAEQTLAELKQLDAGAWKGSAFAGERIPTIAEAIATMPRGRTLFIELKSGIETVPAIARAIRAANPEPRAHLALQGFDAEGLAALAKELPSAPAFWDVDPPMDGDRPLPYPLTIVDEAKRHGFAGLALLHVSVTDELIAEARGVGLEVDVWTINDREPLIAARARDDIRWVETDRPDLAK
jgi:glycerophosphoryl diester phosphodiesterase